jgi:phosphoribosylaminoimidazolecarboxamide formyltransferase / IMP cyclohydrolase
MGEIGTVLVSVYDKTGLSEFAARLVKMGVRMLASGGTAAHLRHGGIECDDVASLTGSTELLSGLVKTLHPGIHAGILADRGNPAHMSELAALGYEKIDMVVVNFYALPGESRSDLSFVDIGGPAMARAAAKNFASCVPVADPSWYGTVAGELEAHGAVRPGLRWSLATDVIRRTGAYDARILEAVGSGPDSMWQQDEVPGCAARGRSLLVGLTQALDLRYGENPHQRGAFFTASGQPAFEVLKGDLSFNNILDLDCCLGQLGEFNSKAAVVTKHSGPCGVAEGGTGAEALERALACDPVAAFGGIVGVNFRFDDACAGLLSKRFVEAIVAPEFEDSALELLMKKRARIVVTGRQAGGVAGPAARARTLLKSALGGVLAQTQDDGPCDEDLRFPGSDPPARNVIDDLVFAWRVVKHVKSNAIVFACGRRTLGIGAGQPSRVDSTRIAIMKAQQAGHDLKGSVMASDGFFPFADSVELAAQAGAAALIQPGGSIRDQEVLAAARKYGLAMAVTSVRHFRH